MPTFNDIATLDYSHTDGPYAAGGLVDTGTLDLSHTDGPFYAASGGGAYNPNMATEFSVDVSFTASLSTSVKLEASFSIDTNFSAFLNLGVSAKLVQIF